jgi:hypothetical protein
MTVKRNGAGNAITPPKTHNEHMHHHNTSMGRIPQSHMLIVSLGRSNSVASSISLNRRQITGGV